MRDLRPYDSSAPSGVIPNVKVQSLTRRQADKAPTPTSNVLSVDLHSTGISRKAPEARTVRATRDRQYTDDAHAITPPPRASPAPTTHRRREKKP